MFRIACMMVLLVYSFAVKAVEMVHLSANQLIDQSETIIFGRLYEKEGKIYLRDSRYVKSGSSKPEGDKEVSTKSDDIFFNLHNYLHHKNLIHKNVYVFGLVEKNMIVIEQGGNSIWLEKLGPVIDDILEYNQINNPDSLLRKLLTDIEGGEKVFSAVQYLDQNTGFVYKSFAEAFILDYVLRSKKKDQFITDFVLNNIPELPQSMVYSYFSSYRLNNYRLHEVESQKTTLFKTWNQSTEFRERKFAFIEKLKRIDIQKYDFLIDSKFETYSEEVISIFSFFLNQKFSGVESLKGSINELKAKEVVLVNSNRKKKSNERYIRRRFEKSSLYVDENGYVGALDDKLSHTDSDIEIANIALDHIRKQSNLIENAKIFVQEKGVMISIYISKQLANQASDLSYFHVVVSKENREIKRVENDVNY